MRGVPGWSISVVVALVFAGCSGGGGDPKDSGLPSSSVSVSGEALPDAGTIQGLVIDDSALPIEGATVGIVGGADLQVATDAAGQFVFSNLAPGTYQLAAQKLGYTSAAKSVLVPANDVATVTFSLQAISVAVPRQETFGPLAGYFECRWAVNYAAGSWTSACGTVCIAVCAGPPVNPWTNDKTQLKFQMGGDDFATVVGDMHWSPSATGTGQELRFAFSHEKRTSTHWWCSGEGKSPLQFRYELDDAASVCANVGSNKDPALPTKDLTLMMYSNTPFTDLGQPPNVALQQKFEIVATVFYVEPAPEGFTGFADG